CKYKNRVGKTNWKKCELPWMAPINAIKSQSLRRNSCSGFSECIATHLFSQVLAMPYAGNKTSTIKLVSLLPLLTLFQPRIKKPHKVAAHTVNMELQSSALQF